MSVYDKLLSDMKDAMKARDKVRLGVIRGIKAQIMNAKVADGNHDLNEDQINDIITKKLSSKRIIGRI